jgi:hypothetical protein
VNNVQNNGHYWYTNEYGSSLAYFLNFSSAGAGMGGGEFRDRGMSVRLVKDL